MQVLSLNEKKEMASSSRILIVENNSLFSATLCQQLALEGFKNVAAGANPLALKRGMDKAVESIRAELRKLSQTVEGKEQIAQVAALSAHEQEVGDLLEIIRKSGKQLVIEAKPKNIYSNSDDIGGEYKSVTFSIVFQHSSKTLEDSDVNPIIDEIVNFAEKKFHAKLRV